MADSAGSISRIQLCGDFAVVAGSQRLEADLPGRRGRLLIAYLAAHRERPVRREQLIADLWPDATAESSATLTVLLSKARAVLGHDSIGGRSSLQLLLPARAVIDTEAATRMLHEAESAVALGQWRRSWGAALGALFTTRRTFLADFDAAWIVEQRVHFALMYQRAVTCYAQACLGIGGTELPAAARAARDLIVRAPLSETGYQLLMRAQAAAGDVASALGTFETLRRRLADELGVDPCLQSRAIHEELLTAGHRSTGS